MSDDPTFPVLADKHYASLDRRVILILQTVRDCLKHKQNVGAQEVIRNWWEIISKSAVQELQTQIRYYDEDMVGWYSRANKSETKWKKECLVPWFSVINYLFNLFVICVGRVCSSTKYTVRQYMTIYLMFLFAIAYSKVLTWSMRLVTPKWRWACTF